MIDEKTFHRLDKTIKAIEQYRDQQVGALEQLMKTLEKEFKCKTIEQAKKKLKKLERECREQEKQLGKRLHKFIKKYRSVLKEIKGVNTKQLRAVAIELQGTKKSRKKNKKTQKRSRNN